MRPGTVAAVTESAVGPYLLRPPAVASPDTDVVLFLPGGGGGIESAMPTYDLWVADGDGIEAFTVVVPYADDGNVHDESDRVLSVLDEVIACTCSSGRVHLAGTSLGGLSAYALMLAESDRFVTLLGAPGAFEGADDADLSSALAGKAVFNGVGENDPTWNGDVRATHQQLLDLGLDSTFVEFAGEGHILSAGFDESIFFEFWSSHR